MKKLFYAAICLVVMVIPAGAATVLSDSQLDSVSAGQLEDVSIHVNDVDLEDSAAAVQSNMGVLASFNDLGGPLAPISNYSDNFATVINVGNSAAALQSNLVATATLMGEIRNCDSGGVNDAMVINLYTMGLIGPTQNGGTGIEGENLLLDLEEDLGVDVQINPAYLSKSASAQQSNITVMLSSDGIRGSSIQNVNSAVVGNAPIELVMGFMGGSGGMIIPRYLDN